MFNKRKRTPPHCSKNHGELPTFPLKCYRWASVSLGWSPTSWSSWFHLMFWASRNPKKWLPSDGQWICRFDPTVTICHDPLASTSLTNLASFLCQIICQISALDSPKKCVFKLRIICRWIELSNYVKKSSHLFAKLIHDIFSTSWWKISPSFQAFP